MTKKVKHLNICEKCNNTYLTNRKEDKWCMKCVAYAFVVGINNFRYEEENLIITIDGKEKICKE